MKKRFTMLLASLFLVMGAAWADFRQEYTTSTAFWTEQQLSGDAYPLGVADVLVGHATDGKVHEVWGAQDKIHVSASGTVSVTFAYVNWSASHAMKILGVDVIASDGSVVASDYHLGHAGGTPSNTAYTLENIENGDYTMRYFVCNRTDNDHQLSKTAGTISVTGADLAETLDVTKTYRLKAANTSLYLEIVDFAKTSGEGALQFKNESSNAGQFFTFEEQSQGKYYLKSVKDNTTFYVTAAGWDLYAKTTAPSEGFTVFSGGTDLYAFYQGYATYKGFLGNINGASDGTYAYNNQDYYSKGNSTWVLEEVDLEGLKNELAALLVLANEISGNAFLGTAEAEALNSAIATAEGLGNNPDFGSVLSAMTTLQAAYTAADDNIRNVDNLDKLSNESYYKVYGERGFIYATDNVVKGSNKASATYDVNNVNQHFAIIKKDEAYYLYNVGAKKFVAKDGNNASLTILPEHAITLANNNNGNYPWNISLNGSKINLSNSGTYGVYTNYETEDGGNRWAMYAAGSFAPAEALAAFDRVYLTVTYTFGEDTYSVTDTITKGKTFSFSNPYPYTTVTSCKVGGQTLEATEGTYSYVVNEETAIVVELADALPFVLTEENDTAWHMLKIRDTKWVKRADSAPYSNNTTLPTDDNGWWAFTGNPFEGYQVLNKAAGEGYTLGFDATSTGSNVYMKEGTTTWTLGKCVKDGKEKGFLLRHGTTGYKYIHDYGSKLQFWDSSSAPTDVGSALVAVLPLTIKYMFKGAELEDIRVEDYVAPGTFSIDNPYPNKYVTIESCTVNDTPLEAKDGVWSLELTEASEVIVTLAEALPFKTSTDYNNAVWHYLQVKSSSWKYVQMNTEDKSTKSTTDVSTLGYESHWAFIGDAINGFKILNKEAEVSYSLSVASTDNGTAAYIVEGEKVWNIERGNGGFIIRQGESECLNDFGGGGVLKVWNNTNSPNDQGSAFRALGFGVTDLSELINPMYMSVYALQAERSPLMYSTTETTKLSSGLFDQLSENASDVNQQFVILRTNRTPEGYFYLYSVGAQKFVGADLTFTDYPEPVLSFEESGHAIYPWWVKIADKYVIPANGGTDGNKLYHITGGDDDDGKRYRIVNVGSYSDYSLITPIEEAEGMIKDVSELSNEKVYTVSTYDRGYWYYNTAADSALWSTSKAGMADVSSSDANVQFAFLTVAEHTYLYSIGAQKFVVKKDGYTTYSDEPTQAIELLDAQGTKFYPFVAAFVNGENKHHIGISNSYTPPVITFYNDLKDGGNKIKLREVTEGYMADGAADLLAAAVAKIDAYLAAQELKPELLALINEAQALLDKNYLDTEDTEALTNAKTTAQGVYDNDAATSEQLTEQIDLLTEAITAATYVREVEDFKNAYVYTFVSNRSATAYMMYDGETDYVASQYMKTGLTVGAEEANCQWAVYTSPRGYYYLYNLGAGKFMGTESAANTSIPFSATPQTTGLTFKVSAVNTHPIMISTDGGAGVANHSNNAFDGKNQAGLLNWAGGFGYTSDGGNVHQVAIVGALAEGTLTTIAEAVKLYEDAKERAEAIQALETAIAAAQAKVDAASDALGYYSSSIANVDTELEAIVAFKEGITESTTVPEIEAQTAAAEEIAASFSLNLPEAGKFYRFKHPAVDAYILSNDTTVNSKKRLAMGALEANKATSIFYYTEEGTLLSYAIGQYLSEANDAISTDWTCKSVGATAPVATFGAGSSIGCLGFYLGDNKSRAYYSGRETYVDAGGSFGSNAGYDWVVEEVTELPVAVSAVGYSTFYTPVAVTVPGTVTAYVVSETSTNSVALKEVTGVVPAGTGLILEGEGDHTFAIATEGIPAEFDKGLLKGSAAKTLVTPEDGYTCYVLANGSQGVGLYKASLNKNEGTAFLNNANKVYLSVEAAAQAAPAMFSFRRGGDTTDIENSELEAQGSQLIYDLSGRRVLNPTKGMYIVNGKKVVSR